MQRLLRELAACTPTPVLQPTAADSADTSTSHNAIFAERALRNLLVLASEEWVAMQDDDQPPQSHNGSSLTETAQQRSATGWLVAPSMHSPDSNTHAPINVGHRHAASHVWVLRMAARSLATTPLVVASWWQASFDVAAARRFYVGRQRFATRRSHEEAMADHSATTRQRAAVISSLIGAWLGPIGERLRPKDEQPTAPAPKTTSSSTRSHQGGGDNPPSSSSPPSPRSDVGHEWWCAVQLLRSLRKSSGVGERADGAHQPPNLTQQHGAHQHFTTVPSAAALTPEPGATQEEICRLMCVATCVPLLCVVVADATFPSAIAAGDSVATQRLPRDGFLLEQQSRPSPREYDPARVAAIETQYTRDAPQRPSSGATSASALPFELPSTQRTLLTALQATEAALAAPLLCALGLITELGRGDAYEKTSEASVRMATLEASLHLERSCRAAASTHASPASPPDMLHLTDRNSTHGRDWLNAIAADVEVKVRSILQDCVEEEGGNRTAMIRASPNRADTDGDRQPANEVGGGGHGTSASRADESLCAWARLVRQVLFFLAYHRDRAITASSSPSTVLDLLFQSAIGVVTPQPIITTANDVPAPPPQRHRAQAAAPLSAAASSRPTSARPASYHHRRQGTPRALRVDRATFASTLGDVMDAGGHAFGSRQLHWGGASSTTTMEKMLLHAPHAPSNGAHHALWLEKAAAQNRGGDAAAEALMFESVSHPDGGDGDAKFIAAPHGPASGGSGVHAAFSANQSWQKRVEGSAAWPSRANEWARMAATEGTDRPVCARCARATPEATRTSGGGSGLMPFHRPLSAGYARSVVGECLAPTMATPHHRHATTPPRAPSSAGRSTTAGHASAARTTGLSPRRDDDTPQQQPPKTSGDVQRNANATVDATTTGNSQAEDSASASPTRVAHAVGTSDGASTTRSNSARRLRGVQHARFVVASPSGGVATDAPGGALGDSKHSRGGFIVTAADFHASLRRQRRAKQRDDAIQQRDAFVETQQTANATSAAALTAHAAVDDPASTSGRGTVVTNGAPRRALLGSAPNRHDVASPHALATRPAPPPPSSLPSATLALAPPLFARSGYNVASRQHRVAALRAHLYATGS